MSVCRKIVVAASLVLLGVAVQAQTREDEVAARMHEVQAQQQEVQARQKEVQARQAEVEQLAQSEAEVAELRMLEAEQRLAEAAQQIAELSARQLPRVAALEKRIVIDGRPVLGVTIGSDDRGGPVEGVTILGVTPGGAAEESGLRAGDTITAINGQPLSSEVEVDAAAALLDFMADVEEGDVLEVEYLRNGKSGSVEVMPKANRAFAFAFGGGDFDVDMPSVAVTPDFEAGHYRWYSAGSVWGEIELVKLTEGLGRYFGTSEGLLVVRAPQNEDIKLRDGDVIQSIDGRVPGDVGHAMRILSSYQGGEKLDIVIMRDKKRLTINVEMPDNRRGQLRDFSMPDVDARVIKIPVHIEHKVEDRT